MEDLKEYFERGLLFSEFLKGTGDGNPPWQDFYQRARVPEGILSRIQELSGSWRFLVLCEPWCGDGANILPYLARAVESAPNLDLRVLRRDENPELMDAHLTRGKRSIPVVMVLDEGFTKRAWWGPRPAPLQEIFLREISLLPQEERYPRLRAWYARDRGRTSLQEIFQLLPTAT